MEEKKAVVDNLKGDLFIIYILIIYRVQNIEFVYYISLFRFVVY